MKNNVNKICNIFTLALTVLALASCSDILNVQNLPPLDNSLGVVRISVNSGKSASNDEGLNYASASVQPRTFYPVSNEDKYTFRFTAQPAETGQEKILEYTNKSLINDKCDITLETGEWIVEVIRYEVDDTGVYPVANGTSDSFPVVPGSNADVEVDINPIEGGTGRFSYTVSVDSPIDAEGSLELRRIGGGASFVVPLKLNTIDGRTAADTLYDIPSGNYDALVSLTSGGKGTGKHSAAIIYPGLETEVSADFFSFSIDNFVQYINLAGYIDFDSSCTVKPDPASNSVTVTALVSGTGATIPGIITNPIKWEDNSHTSAQEWKILHIPAANRSLDLRVTIQGSDSKTYIIEKALTLNNIPDEGKYDISVPVGIYSINTSSLPSGSVSVKVLGDGRDHASQGEKVILGDESTYGIKNGTLKYTYGGNTITIPDADRSFIMPKADVTLNAAFFNTNLQTLTVTDSEGTPWVPDLIGGVYSVTLPNNISSIQVSATPDDPDVGVKVTGPVNNLSSAAINVITITLTPPPGLGGKLSRAYTLNVTREGSCDLASLTVSRGGTIFNPVKTSADSYSLVLDNGITPIIVNAAPVDSNAVVSYEISDVPYGSGPSSDSITLPVGQTVISITVSDAGNSSQNTYNLTVKHLSTDASIGSITLSKGLDSWLVTTPPVGNVYSVNVPYNASPIDITVDPSHSGAKPLGNKTGVPLAVGVINTFEIYIIPESGPAAPYILKITRLEPDKYLQGIDIDAGIYALIPEFDPETFYYEVKVPYDTSEITVTATAPEGGKVEGEDTYTHTYTLKGDGTDVIIITAIAQDNYFSTPYTITVIVEPEEEPEDP